MIMLPDHAWFSPTRARKMVDFPEPLSPTIPKHSPGATAKLTPFTTSVSPKEMRKLSKINLALDFSMLSVMMFSTPRHAPAPATAHADVLVMAGTPADHGYMDAAR